MKLEEKRRVVEVLLCCGDPATGDIAADNWHEHMHLSLETFAAADQAWDAVHEAWVDRYLSGHCDAPIDPSVESAAGYTEAAYRLIESSPTLRREWFGRGAR